MNVQPHSSIAFKNGKKNVTQRYCMSYLSKNYQPSSNDVVVGRGKKCYNHEGNKRLRFIVDSKLEEYSMATSKSEKSTILGKVVKQIRSEDSNGKFVRQDQKTKLWFDIGDDLAMQKVSQTFRDALIHFESPRDAAMAKRKPEDCDENHFSVKKLRLSMVTDCQRSSLHAKNSFGTSDKILESNTDNLSPLAYKMLLYDNPYEPTPLEEILEGKRCFQRTSDFIPLNQMAEHKTKKMKNFQEPTNYTGSKIVPDRNKIVEEEKLEDIDTSGLSIPMI